jgi:hypothetical protein
VLGLDGMGSLSLTETGKYTNSWENIWLPLLAAAVDNSNHGCQTKHDEIPSRAASIILARTAIEAYISEYIVWRSLDVGNQRLPLHKKVDRIRTLMECDNVPIYEQISGGDLVLLNDLRNALIHHDASTYGSALSPKDVLNRLKKRGILAHIKGDINWERQVLCRQVSSWACRVAAETILTFESIPVKRIRSFCAIQSAIQHEMFRLIRE